MARTDEGLVEEVLNNYNEDVSLSVFVDDASLIVGQIIPSDSGYSNTLLQRIETYVAAHLYEMVHGRVASERIGSSGGAGLSESYSFKGGMGFDQTVYGQMAKRVDVGGYLAGHDNAMNTIKLSPIKPAILYLGKDDE